VSGFKEELLAMSADRRPRKRIDAWMESNPEQAEDLRQLLDDFVAVRRDGSRVSASALASLVESKFGLRLTYTPYLEWLREKYPDDQDALKW